MERDGWFDGRRLDLYQDDFMNAHPAWRIFLEDGVITEEELREQREKLVRKLRRLEPRLDEDLHGEVTEILLEYEVYFRMALVYGREGKIDPAALGLTGPA